MADAPLTSSSPDPDNYRMSLGEHLEELRRRLIRALIGFAVAAAVCAYWGNDIVSFFCRPLVKVLVHNNLNPQLIYTEVGESVSLYFYVVSISAAVIAAPWMLYQLWLFVAAGLYPREQRIAKRFAPLSLLLLIAGVVFCYLVVLPASLEFFIDFSGSFPLRGERITMPATAPATAQPFQVPILTSDPSPLQPGQLWFNATERRLNFAMPAAKASDPPQAMSLQFAPSNLLVPYIRVSDYVDMVLLWLLIFAVAFQMPLLQMAAVRIGIISVKTLRSGRRVAYLAITVIAAFIMPDVFSGTLALMLPLVILYEFGIYLARLAERRQ